MLHFVPDIRNWKSFPTIANHWRKLPSLNQHGTVKSKIFYWLSQPSLICAAYFGSFLLRFDFAPEARYLRMFAQTLPVVLALKLVIFRGFGLSRGLWRYASLNDLVEITKATLLSTAALIAILQFLFHPPGFPRSIFVLDFALTILLMGGARFAFRAWREAMLSGRGKKNTLIIGAGNAGSDILRDLRRHGNIEYRPVGLVDDDHHKLGIWIYGIKVLGTTEELPKLIEQHGVECVLIAIPSAPGAVIERIISKCKQCNVDFRIVPGIEERLNRPVSVSQLRGVRLEDLLGRKPVQLDLQEMREQFRGQAVLVTGAGGSIGSELVRQVAQFGPKKIVMLDRSENDLFKISIEMASRFPAIDCVVAIGDILDVKFLRETFSRHQPSAVFHAAAYKHVPMMENNCFQAITNNIFGTYNVALMAKHHRVSNFVMISSDKAVRPSNVMGVTKRVAELIVLSLQGPATRFISVRFGNVLGSNGSVVPIFQQQIAERRPITVTHAEITRYFMTIPEAVQLVLQASTMGKGGEIFVLNMGEPIKIVELARRLLQLSGLAPDEIPIVFTGLRSGEKLHEETMLESEGVVPTGHADIRMLRGQYQNFEQVRQWLEDLAALVESQNISALIGKLKAIVPEYTPSPEILSRCDLDRHDVVDSYLREGTAFARMSLPVGEAA
jgi:FlaA1/EpsC-like NDP-sugar epimerase